MTIGLISILYIKIMSLYRGIRTASKDSFYTQIKHCFSFIKHYIKIFIYEIKICKEEIKKKILCKIKFAYEIYDIICDLEKKIHIRHFPQCISKAIHIYKSL